MPTYIYETIPAGCCDEPKYYEIAQNEQDAPLAEHPETGEPIQRVLINGETLIKSEEEGGSCGCGSGGCC